MEAKADTEIDKTLAETTHTAVAAVEVDTVATIPQQLVRQLPLRPRLERPALLRERTMQPSMRSTMVDKIRMRRMVAMLHMSHIISTMPPNKLEPAVLRAQRLARHQARPQALLPPLTHLLHPQAKLLLHLQGLDHLLPQDHHLEMVTMRYSIPVTHGPKSALMVN